MHELFNNMHLEKIGWIGLKWKFTLSQAGLPWPSYNTSTHTFVNHSCRQIKNLYEFYQNSLFF